VSDAAHHCVQLRIDLLFTMSDNLHRVIEDRRDTNSSSWTSLDFPSTSIDSHDQPLLHSKSLKTWLGGARRDRTDDLLLAKQALSQLSYGPGQDAKVTRLKEWWAWEDSNFRPHAYQARALTN
jgi:hypothetical protein